MSDNEQPAQKSVDQRIEALVSLLELEAKARAEAEAVALRRHAEAEAVALRRNAEADERLKRLELRTEAHAMNLELLTIDIQQQRRNIDRIDEHVQALTAGMENIRLLQPLLVELIRHHDARIGKLEQR